MTVTVRSHGAGDLLYEPPVLIADNGQQLMIDAMSLEAARYAFLDLVTKGQAMTQLKFAGNVLDAAHLTLVFNPRRDADDEVAPRTEIFVPLRP